MRECETCKRCFTDETLLCPQDGAQTTGSLLGEPTVDGRYQLERRLGKGSMGIVFEARHIFLKTSHAIKAVLPYFVGDDPTLLTRFRQQALVAASLHHQNIVAITDFGVMSKTMPFLVMELLHGKSLQDTLGEEKVMTPRRALEFVGAIAAGLGQAHRQNIWHHDLKPSNIIVQDGMPIAEGLKILDFGLVKIISIKRLAELVREYHYWKDSFFYMAPEQWTNRWPDAGADIYSLGVILYQMLSGKLPFQGSPQALVEKHLAMPPPRFESLGIKVSPRLEAVVRETLEKDVFMRPPSVDAFLAELSAAVNSTDPILKPGRPPLPRQIADLESPPEASVLPTGASATPRDSLARLMNTYPEGFVGSSRGGMNESEQTQREIEEAQRQEREREPERNLQEFEDLRRRYVSVTPNPVTVSGSLSQPAQESIILPSGPQGSQAGGTTRQDNSPLLTTSSPQAAPTAETPIYLDENVQFTVYKPKKIRPQEWYTLLAYAHLSERRPGEDEEDPIERMETEVKRILGEQKLESYSRATEDSSQAVPRRGEITFVPFVDGIEFNPPSQSFLWQESVHGQEFRMLASAALDGKTARGQVSVFLGSILLAEINVSLRVDSTQVLTDKPVPLEKEAPARPYRNVFASYSHKDIEIVAQIEQYAQISGDKYLRDVFELRSGQNWKQWMRKAIEAADIFQLFWSTNSMRSENVRLEWQYALRLGRPNFIRPTYWESPLPQSPADNLPPPELLDLHFQQVRSPLSVSVASPKQDDVAGAKDRSSLTRADAPLAPPGDSPAQSRSETSARLMSARPSLLTAGALTQTGAASVVSTAWAPPTAVSAPATARSFPVWIGLLAIVFAIVGLIVGLLILLLVTRK